MPKFTEQMSRGTRTWPRFDFRTCSLSLHHTEQRHRRRKAQRTWEIEKRLVRSEQMGMGLVSGHQIAEAWKFC